MRPVLIIFLGLFLSLNGTAQIAINPYKDCPPEDVEMLLRKNNMFKAKFLSLLISEIEFSKRQRNKQIDIAFLDAEHVKEYFDKTNKAKEISNFKSHSISDLSDIKKYQVVYIDCNFDVEEEQLKKILGRSKTLVVTENQMLPTYMINFMIEDCKIQYEVNLEALNKQRLVPSRNLIEQSKNYL